MIIIYSVITCYITNFITSNQQLSFQNMICSFLFIICKKITFISIDLIIFKLHYFIVDLNSNNIFVNLPLHIISFIYQSMHISLYLFILLLHRDPLIYLYIHLPNCLFIYLYQCIHLSIHPYIYPSINLSLHPSIYLSIHLYVHTSIHPSIHLSIYLSIYQSI